jgi:hypothetical protein
MSSPRSIYQERITFSISFVIQLCSFIHIASYENGSAIYVNFDSSDVNSNFTIQESLFYNVSSQGSGGACYIDIHAKLLTQSTCFVKTSAQKGRSIYLGIGVNEFQIYDNSFSGCLFKDPNVRFSSCITQEDRDYSNSGNFDVHFLNFTALGDHLGGTQEDASCLALAKTYHYHINFLNIYQPGQNVLIFFCSQEMVYFSKCNFIETQYPSIYYPISISGSTPDQIVMRFQPSLTLLSDFYLDRSTRRPR